MNRSQVLCMQYLHGGWPEGLPKDDGPQRYGPKRAEWVRVDQVDARRLMAMLIDAQLDL